MDPVAGAPGSTAYFLARVKHSPPTSAEEYPHPTKSDRMPGGVSQGSVVTNSGTPCPKDRVMNARFARQTRQDFRTALCIVSMLYVTFTFGGRNLADAGEHLDEDPNFPEAIENPDPPTYELCGVSVSYEEFTSATLFQFQRAEILNAAYFSLPVDLCTEHLMLHLDEEPLFYEGVYIPEAVNPGDPNEIILDEFRDIPVLGQRITGQRCFGDPVFDTEPFCAEVLENWRLDVNEAELPVELQGKNYRESLLFAYVSADVSQLDPNTFNPDPNGACAVIGGICFSYDDDSGRVTEFLPLDLVDDSYAIDALELHAEIQQGFVGSRSYAGSYCAPEASNELEYTACEAWADRQFDLCMTQAKSNLRSCKDRVWIALV